MMISTRSLGPVFFGEITGVSLRKPLDAATIRAIVAALDRHAVVVLPDQPLTDEEQIAFSQQMGGLSYALNHGRKTGQKARLRAELYDISNLNEESAILDRDDRRRAWREGDRLWHTDRSFIDADTTYSLLSARVIPPEGGDTEFADMRAAYDALDTAMKARRGRPSRSPARTWRRSIVHAPVPCSPRATLGSCAPRSWELRRRWR